MKSSQKAKCLCCGHWWWIDARPLTHRCPCCDNKVYKTITRESWMASLDQRSAHRKVYKAVISGVLKPKNVCELCGETKETNKYFRINAHHWNGYDHPLDVWWICTGCNSILKHKHDGSLTLEQAKNAMNTEENQWLYE